MSVASAPAASHSSAEQLVERTRGPRPVSSASPPGFIITYDTRLIRSSPNRICGFIAPAHASTSPVRRSQRWPATVVEPTSNATPSARVVEAGPDGDRRRGRRARRPWRSSPPVAERPLQARQHDRDRTESRSSSQSRSSASQQPLEVAARRRQVRLARPRRSAAGPPGRPRSGARRPPCAPPACGPGSPAARRPRGRPRSARGSPGAGPAPGPRALGSVRSGSVNGVRCSAALAMPCLGNSPAPSARPGSARRSRGPPHTESRSTPSDRAASSSDVPCANRPRAPDGREDDERALGGGVASRRWRRLRGAQRAAGHRAAAPAAAAAPPPLPPLRSRVASRSSADACASVPISTSAAMTAGLHLLVQRVR